MIKLNEYDDRYDEIPSYWDDAEYGVHKLTYFTYYSDPTDFICGVDEEEDVLDPSEYNGDDVDVDKEILDMKLEIDSDVEDGEYEGLWVHYLKVEVETVIETTYSNDWYEEDDAEMSSQLIDASYESKFIPPEEYEDYGFMPDHFE